MAGTENCHADVDCFHCICDIWTLFGTTDQHSHGMMNASIGILDSGFGGLSIYKSIHTLLPHESTVYIGDHAYLPYGKKSKQQIRARVKKLMKFLINQNVKLIVVACNTATIAGIDQYRIWFPLIPIIGVVPVVKTAAEVTKRNAFAVLSTEFTAKSNYQKKLIKKFAPDAQVYNIGCPNLLSYVEKGIFDSPTINRELRLLLPLRMREEVDVVVLGCTHYPFLRKTIRAIIGKEIQLLDSGGAVARHVARILTHNKIGVKKGTCYHEFYSTGAKDSSQVASKLLGKKMQVHYARI